MAEPASSCLCACSDTQDETGSALINDESSKIGARHCTRWKQQYMAAMVADASPIIQDKGSLHVLDVSLGV